jgi:23S rRNA (adenine1618-N6)-methyltransferase
MEQRPLKKPGFHPRNLHGDPYDFGQLFEITPGLSRFVRLNVHGDPTVDFADPCAVKMLNKALLKHFYGIEYWDIPEGYLCPSVPGRAEYIHRMADVISGLGGVLVTGEQVRCLDIGTGASCVYPIIGRSAYGWSFTGTETDEAAIRSAAEIVERNPLLAGKVELRRQADRRSIFSGVVHDGDRFDLVICNPPFHSNASDAYWANASKTSNLTKGKMNKPLLNFGGMPAELWCEGGEEQFIYTMICESKDYSGVCNWFSTLVSKQRTLKSVYGALNKSAATGIQTIPLGYGNKRSRIVAWTFSGRSDRSNRRGFQELRKSVTE